MSGGEQGGASHDGTGGSIGGNPGAGGNKGGLGGGSGGGSGKSGDGTGGGQGGSAGKGGSGGGGVGQGNNGGGSQPNSEPGTPPPYGPDLEDAAGHSARYGDGVLAGYCQGLNLGRDHGQRDGRNNVKNTDPLPPVPPAYTRDIEAAIEAGGPEAISQPSLDFDNGFIAGFEKGFADGYGLGDEFGLAQFKESAAAAKNDDEKVAAEQEQSANLAKQFGILLNRWCLGVSMGPTQDTEQSELALATSVSKAAPSAASYTPEIQAALAQIWQQAQQSGVLNADLSDSFDQMADVAGITTIAEKQAGEDASAAAQATDASASQSEANASQAKGSSAQAEQDAQAEAEKADSA
jgi:hypothetical protein